MAMCMCVWTYDEVHQQWNTQCGGVFHFANEQSVEENGFNYCPYCGGLIL